MNSSTMSTGGPKWSKETIVVICSMTGLALGLIMDHVVNVSPFKGSTRLIWYLIVCLPVAWPVVNKGWSLLIKGQVLTEYTLMALACMGAFAIGEYAEGTAVMLFYTIGELLQHRAVSRSRKQIVDLLSNRTREVTVMKNDQPSVVNPRDVEIGDLVRIKAGEEVAIDGRLLSGRASMNLSALTGESQPVVFHKNEEVFAGSINTGEVIDLEVFRRYENSAIARMLHLVQEASAHKAPTELLIRRFARIYTPIVVFMALGICFLPMLLSADYDLDTWLYRALIFLVISCPCALVIAVPLGYFAGLGFASKNGILFKGAEVLDRLQSIEVLALDKTGTLTVGQPEIQKIHSNGKYSTDDVVKYVLAVEQYSSHPLARSLIKKRDKSQKLPEAKNISEKPGFGISGWVENNKITIGNEVYLHSMNINTRSNDSNHSKIHIGINDDYAGYIEMSDPLRNDAREVIDNLRRGGIKKIVILSGDKGPLVRQVADRLNIEDAKGDLKPEDKLNEVHRLQKETGQRVAFVGDGINDAPVLAGADVGIAIGSKSSDLALESADALIRTDRLASLETAIKISRKTRHVQYQNIAFALVFKAGILALGAVGLANLWAAVIADVGVALLVILNAMRIGHMTSPHKGSQDASLGLPARP